MSSNGLFHQKANYCSNQLAGKGEFSEKSVFFLEALKRSISSHYFGLFDVVFDDNDSNFHVGGHVLGLAGDIQNCVFIIFNIIDMGLWDGF